ncbi:unnamed protein product [Darwinula stevensoni]|uniref:CARD domain-containing protein n=1 Tax=Darwinula stevensoni TaxID=69355 RepID=A0A7R8XBH3_9CRUS|nr:unnamed protein product [Darwinula stevensoni]CAG0892383.1 unnamed protein product [Darwinula stevensoni]
MRSGRRKRKEISAGMETMDASSQTHQLRVRGVPKRDVMRMKIVDDILHHRLHLHHHYKVLLIMEEKIEAMKYLIKWKVVIDIDRFLDELVKKKLILPVKASELRSKKYHKQMDCIFSELGTRNPEKTYGRLLSILDKMERRDIAAALSAQRGSRQRAPMVYLGAGPDGMKMIRKSRWRNVRLSLVRWMQIRHRDSMDSVLSIPFRPTISIDLPSETSHAISGGSSNGDRGDISHALEQVENEKKALEAQIDEISKVLAMEKGLQAKHMIRIGNLEKQIEKEKSMREEKEQEEHILLDELNKARLEVEELKQKLSNALDEEKKAKDQLEKSERKEAERGRRTMDGLLMEKEEIQPELDTLMMEPSEMKAFPSPMQAKDEAPQWQRDKMPRRHVMENKDDLFASLINNELVAIHVYSHARVTTEEVEEMERRISGKMTHIVFLDADLDADWTLHYFGSELWNEKLKLIGSDYWIILKARTSADLDDMDDFFSSIPSFRIPNWGVRKSCLCDHVVDVLWTARNRLRCFREAPGETSHEETEGADRDDAVIAVAFETSLDD